MHNITQTKIDVEDETAINTHELSYFLENRQNKEHPIYIAQKKSALIYQLAFIVISIFFIVLAYYSYSLTTSWICSIYLDLENCAMIKGFVSVLCLLMAGAAFKLFHTICPKKDTAYKILKRYENKFIKFHRTAEITGLVEELYPEANENIEKLSPYKEEVIIDKMYELYEDALHLLEEISSHKSSDKTQKHAWINQTFLEFQEKLDWMIGITKAPQLDMRDIDIQQQLES